MNRIAASVLVASIVLAAASQTFAHHSAAAFDTQKEVRTTGTVTAFAFRNPHVYLVLQVKRPDGSTGSVEVEAGAASVLNPLGFTRNSLAVGDTVTIVGNPARAKPDALMLGKDLYKQDGAYYPLFIGSRSVSPTSNASARTIAGTWFSPYSEFNAYGAAVRTWPLTDAGKAAKVKAITGDWLAVMTAWHREHDAEINRLWGEWTTARFSWEGDPMSVRLCRCSGKSTRHEIQRLHNGTERFEVLVRTP